MATDDSDATTSDDDQPSVRQLLHAATGDRAAEAKALADRADGEVSDEAAERAVRLAEGDVHGEEQPEHDVASPEDAKAVSGEG
jgi:hypothetical protein